MEAKFYSTKGPYGFCSNFYRASIFVDEKLWPTSEHYYQAMKMPSDEHKEWIRLADTPKVAARLGRTLPIRQDWDIIKYEIMKKAVSAKFQQHPELMHKLLKTSPLILIEDTVGSPRPDPVWGNGEYGEGKNWLGKILMEIRDNGPKI